MDFPFACLLHTTLLSLLCGNYAIENVKYRPYGPMKCLETCLNSVGISGSITKYHCLRVSTNDPDNPESRSVEDTFICLTPHEKVFADLGGKDRVDTETKDSKSFILAEKPGDRTFDQRLRLTTEELHNEDLKRVQCTKDVDIINACKKGRLERVKEILSQGLDNINCRGKYERTPVMFAVRNGHEEVFDFLKSQGCDLSALDKFGYTVLHLACKNGNVDLVKKLMDEKKIDVFSRSNFGVTPVLSAADPTAVDNDGDTMLHLACFGDCIDVVSFILSKDLISIESSGAEGQTPIIVAAKHGNISLIEVLVRKGCNLREVDAWGNSILHVGCERGNVDIVKYLIDLSEINKEVKNEEGKTPVQVAEDAGHEDVVNVFKARL